MLKDNPVMKKLVATGEERIGKIAQQLLSDREAHDKTAAEWTRRYAQG
jgi:hypothetical protein